MPEQRMPYLAAEEAKKRAEQADLSPQLAELNIFRTLLHNPPLAKAASDLLLTLLFKSSLDHRLRELVIMRIGWATDAVYEWTQHWKIALEQFGCTEEDLLALRDWQNAPHFGPAERAVLQATDEILDEGCISDATWQQCEASLGEELTRMELVTSIATWHWISQVTRSLGVTLEDGVEAWPPDGKTPRD